MITRLALRNFTDRPLRTALLLLGYALGVGVMIVLLAIGEALLIQAQDERLVGGGEITVLPEGIDVEVLKTGGLGGLFFSIDHARFIYLQLLASPRHAASIRAVAPQIDGKLLYLRRDSADIPVRASAGIPSRNRLVGAGLTLAAGAWEDDVLDRRWIAPTVAELRADIDRFHLPPEQVDDRASWAEWHYFNVLSEDGERWAFISFIIAGEVPDGRWGGQVLVTTHEQGGAVRRYAITVPPERIRFSTEIPDLRIGDSFVELRPDGRYRVVAIVPPERGGGPPLSLDLLVTPAPLAYFPGAAIGGAEFVSGYTVPALRATAVGELCAAGGCERFANVQAYHDHNWGVWRGVTWEWGTAQAGQWAVLYGQVQTPETVATTAPLFVYLVDSLGFAGIFRPGRIDYEDARTVVVDGERIRVPARAVLADVRGDDTLRIEIEIADAVATDTRRALIERGDASAARALERPYFIQMKGTARITGRIDGRPLEAVGEGFFETYR